MQPRDAALDAVVVRVLGERIEDDLPGSVLPPRPLETARLLAKAAGLAGCREVRVELERERSLLASCV